MVGIDLRYQQRNLINKLKDEGILDHRFDEVFELRGDNLPFLVDVISLYIIFADNAIAEIDKYMNGPVIEFAKVNSYAHHLRGNSTSVGARQVSEASRDLRTASNNIDKDGCFEAFNKLKDVYQILKHNINVIAEIERTLISNRTRNDSRLRP